MAFGPFKAPYKHLLKGRGYQAYVILSKAYRKYLQEGFHLHCLIPHCLNHLIQKLQKNVPHLTVLISPVKLSRPGKILHKPFQPFRHFQFTQEFIQCSTYFLPGIFPFYFLIQLQKRCHRCFSRFIHSLQRLNAIPQGVAPILFPYPAATLYTVCQHIILQKIQISSVNSGQACLQIPENSFI